MRRSTVLSLSSPLVRVPWLGSYLSILGRSHSARCPRCLDEIAQCLLVIHNRFLDSTTVVTQSAYKIIINVLLIKLDVIKILNWWPSLNPILKGICWHGKKAHHVTGYISFLLPRKPVSGSSFSLIRLDHNHLKNVSVNQDFYFGTSGGKIIIFI